MSYIERHLLPDEQISYFTNLHWIVFLLPLVVTIAAIIISQYNTSMEYVNYGAYVICFVFWASSYVKFLTTEFAVTERRLLRKVGFLRINSVEVYLQRIESIEVQQSFIGRIFNYGNIIVNGTGGNKDVFMMVANPMEFRNQIQEQVDKKAT